MNLLRQRFTVAAGVIEIVQRQYFGGPAAGFGLGFHHPRQRALAAALQAGQAEDIWPARTGDAPGVLVEQVAGQGLVLHVGRGTSSAG